MFKVLFPMVVGITHIHMFGCMYVSMLVYVYMPYECLGKYKVDLNESMHSYLHI